MLAVIGILAVGGLYWYQVEQGAKKAIAEQTEALQKLSGIQSKPVECVRVELLDDKAKRAEYYVPVALLKYVKQEKKLDGAEIRNKSGIAANDNNVICVFEAVDSNKKKPLIFKDEALEVARLKKYIDGSKSKNLPEYVTRNLSEDVIEEMNAATKKSR